MNDDQLEGRDCSGAGFENELLKYLLRVSNQKQTGTSLGKNLEGSIWADGVQGNLETVHGVEFVSTKTKTLE